MILGGVIPLALGIIGILCALTVAVISISFYSKLSSNCESQSLRTNLRVMIITSVSIATILITWFICETMCREGGRRNITRAKGLDIFVHFSTLVAGIMIAVLNGSISSKNNDNCKAKAGSEDSLCCIDSNSSTFSWMSKTVTFSSVIMICISVYFLFQVGSQYSKKLQEKYAEQDEEYEKQADVALNQKYARERKAAQKKLASERRAARKRLEMAEIKAKKEHDEAEHKKFLEETEAEIKALEKGPEGEVDPEDIKRDQERLAAIKEVSDARKAAIKKHRESQHKKLLERAKREKEQLAKGLAKGLAKKNIYRNRRFYVDDDSDDDSDDDIYY